MNRAMPLSSTALAIMLLLATTAEAATGSFGSVQKSAQSTPGPITLARHGGSTMGMHMRSAGPVAGPHISRGPALHAYSAPHMHHLHHHHRRFFFAGVPYNSYAYDPDCYWSRRYHRWICPSY